MYQWELSDPAIEELAGAPIDCDTALAAFLDAVVFDPWEFGRPDGGIADKDKAHRTLPFGEGRGLVSFLVYEPDRLVFVTKILWFG